jgi:hypothetical protein
MRAPPTMTAIMPHSMFVSVTGAPWVGVGVWLGNFVADETFDRINDTGGRFVADDLCVAMPSIWSDAVLTVTVDRPAYDKKSSLSMTYAHLCILAVGAAGGEPESHIYRKVLWVFFWFHSRLMQSSVVTRTQF